MTVRFLGVEEVIGIHARQLSEFGGGEGIRDQGLLASAIAQPEASFAGEYLHQDLYEMAAAYLFHLVQNHPFVDGNKRVGLLAALVFLGTNGVVIEESSAKLYELTLAVAEGRADKEQIASVLRSCVESAGS